MDNLSKIEEMIDTASGYLRDAQELLSLTDPREVAIGGGLSVIEVALRTVSEVLESVIFNRGLPAPAAGEQGAIMGYLKKIGTVQTIDIETGEVIAEKKNAFTVLPCAEGLCQECAVDHPWDQPHNQQSMHYQYQFYSTHGRFPTCETGEHDG